MKDEEDLSWDGKLLELIVWLIETMKMNGSGFFLLRYKLFYVFSDLGL